MTTTTCPRCEGSGYVLWVVESVPGEPTHSRMVPKPHPAPEGERRPPPNVAACTNCMATGTVIEGREG